MKVYFVCPFSKPEFKQLVIQNFAQQVYREKHLVVVENGMGINSFDQSANVTVLRSEKHQSKAKNIGLAHLRDIGAEYWATLDCDDYYGPDYLVEMISHADKAPIVGKRCYYVRLGNGKLVFYNKEIGPDYYPTIWGATIGAWVEKSPDFGIHDLSEESYWIKKFHPLKDVYNTGPDNFIHLRWNHGHITKRMDIRYWERIKSSGLKESEYPSFFKNFLERNEYHLKSPLYDERRADYLASLSAR